MKQLNGLWFTLGLVVILTFSLMSESHAQQSEIRILVNPTVEAAELSPGQLRRIFSMRQTNWPDGQPIRVFVLQRESKAHHQLCTQILKLFPYQMDKLWNKLVYSGIGNYPTFVKDESEMLESLRNNPGAIGYSTLTEGTDDLSVISVSME